MNIYEKLQNARVELQDLNLKKSGKNNFAKFNYFELTDFLPEVNKIFNNSKLCTNFSIINEIAVLCIINIEKPDEFVEFKSHIASSDVKGCTPIQSLGAVHTYMKRYLYLNALEIVEADSLDPLVGSAKQLINSGDNTTTKPNNFKSVDELPFSNDFPECCECHKSVDKNTVARCVNLDYIVCSRECADKHELRKGVINGVKK